MNLYAQIASNKRNSILLVLILLLVIAGIAYVFTSIYGYAPWSVTLIAVAVSLVYTAMSYFWGGSLIMTMSGAKEITSKHEHFELFTLVENLCIGSGLPRPRIYVIDDQSPNAFATGRDPEHAMLCFTTGILDKLERSELEGVVAHELAHVKNFDIRFTMMVVALVGVIAFMSDILLRMTIWGGGRERKGGANGPMLIIGLVMLVVAPIVATIIKLAISRQREYLADASAAYLTRNPEGLARALEKISGDPTPLARAGGATESLYIVNPLRGEHGKWLSNLFSTHPPIEDRVKKLRQL